MNSQHVQSQLDMARNTHDLKGLDGLRRAAQQGDESALKEAAQQFEALFVQMMLKSMRKAQDAIADEDSPFNSEQVKFYRDMHDQQMAVDLASKGSMGMADLILQQFSPGKNGFMPGNVLRNDADLSSLNRQRIDSRQQAELQVTGEQPITDRAFKTAAFESPDAFVDALMNVAGDAAKALGLPAKALVAQAAVETGWGQRLIHQADGTNSHNLFGIKADGRWQGDKAVVDTLEFRDGVAQSEKAQFRAYPSFAESLKDYSDFISSQPRYQEAMRKSAEPSEYFMALQKAGYATDPNYADKVMSVLNSPLLAGVEREGGE